MRMRLKLSPSWADSALAQSADRTDAAIGSASRASKSESVDLTLCIEAAYAFRTLSPRALATAFNSSRPGFVITPPSTA